MYFRPDVKNKKKMKMNEASQMQTLIDNSQWIDIRVDLIKSITSHNVNWQFQLQVASIINVHMGRTYLMVSDYFAQVMTTNQQDETKPICLVMFQFGRW